MNNVIKKICLIIAIFPFVGVFADEDQLNEALLQEELIIPAISNNDLLQQNEESQNAADQQEIKVTLADFRFEELSTTMNGIEFQIQDVKSQMQRIGTIEGEMNGLNLSVDNLSKQVNSFEKNIERSCMCLERSIGRICLENQSLREEIGSYQLDLLYRINCLENQISSLKCALYPRDIEDEYEYADVPYEEEYYPAPWYWSRVTRLQTYIDVVGAWRIDAVQSKFIQDNIDPPEPSIVTTDIKNVDIWQVGVKAQVAWRNWFVRGEAYYGHIPNNDGSFREVHAFPDPPFQIRTGDISGHTRDGEIGVGYFFPTCETSCFGWAPMVGWAYNEQKYKEENVNIVGISGTEFNTSWNGPWVGIDLLYQMLDCLQVNAGYRLHFTKWHHEENFPDGFFQHSHASVVYGNTLYLDARWDFLCHFYIDLDLSYKVYSIGRKNPFVTVSAGQLDHYESEYHWYSFAAGLSLGYHF